MITTKDKWSPPMVLDCTTGGPDADPDVFFSRLCGLWRQVFNVRCTDISVWLAGARQRPIADVRREVGQTFGSHLVVLVDPEDVT